MGGKRVVLLFWLVLLSSLILGEVRINEVMPHSNNPLNDEWVELFNDGADNISLTGWRISDGSGNDTFSLNITSGGFALIVDNAVSFNNKAGCEAVYGFLNYSNFSCFETPTIGDRGLKDDGESIILYDNYSILINTFSWNTDIKADGKSWFYNGSWHAGTPTPGKDNLACTNPATAVDVLTVPCDIVLNITTDKFIYVKGESIRFKTELNDESFPFEIEYWIEDLFGNIYKNKYVSTNTNQKSWKTNIDEEDRILLIKATANSSCNDTNLENNRAEKMFVVTNLLGEEPTVESTEERNSVIEIKTVSPAEINFGDLINVEVEIYKNSTGKYALSAWGEKDGKRISYETKFHLKSKNTAYKLFLPIQLKPNCDGKIEDGKANLVVEGLGQKAEKEITVSGVNEDFCQDSLAGDLEEKKERSYQIVDLPVSIWAGEELTAVVKLEGDAKEHSYQAWSYLYRGSKCYSCSGRKERDNNLIEFWLDENEEKEIKLLVRADNEMEEGEYKLKVKLNKDGQKTDDELTQSIYVRATGKKEDKKESNQSLCLLNGNSELVNKEIVGGTTPKMSNKKKEILNEIKGIVIYESSSEKARGWILYLIIAVLSLLCLILGWRRI